MIEKSPVPRTVLYPLILSTALLRAATQPPASPRRTHDSDLGPIQQAVLITTTFRTPAPIDSRCNQVRHDHVDPTWSGTQMPRGRTVTTDFMPKRLTVAA